MKPMSTSSQTFPADTHTMPKIMGLDYSQKRLLGKTFHRKGSAHRGMRRKSNWKENLEMYAFLTGFMSTLISLVQVIILALKK